MTRIEMTEESRVPAAEGSNTAAFKPSSTIQLSLIYFSGSEQNFLVSMNVPLFVLDSDEGKESWRISKFI